MEVGRVEEADPAGFGFSAPEPRAGGRKSADKAFALFVLLENIS
jgi:hypothetical protein